MTEGMQAITSVGRIDAAVAPEAAQARRQVEALPEEQGTPAVPMLEEGKGDKVNVLA